jgi:hypothetical protein
MHNKTTKLKISLVCNVLFIVVFLFIAYYKRDRIVFYANKYLTPNKLEKDIASVYNPEPYQTDINFINVEKYPRKIKVAIMGNSLSLIKDWKQGAGLTASDAEHDYIHLLLNKISETKQYGIEFIIINIAEFERGYNDFNYARLEEIKDFNADIVIFQIGENVSTEDITENGEIFKEKYINLIKYFNIEKTIICLPFWPQKDKLRIITDVALITNTYLVDLSHLGSGIEPLNFAKAENKYENAGVGMYPGDYGMNSIANILYITMNKLIE